MAAVTLRLALNPEVTDVLETAWIYSLEESTKLTETTWDVVDRVNECAQTGSAIEARSGLVVITPDRAKAHNWALSESIGSAEAVCIIQQKITGELPFEIL